MESHDKFIGFVDILGFESLVERAEKGEGMSLKEIDEAVRNLGSEADRQAIKKYGPTICPMALRQSQDLDFQITQVSDCVIVSAELSPAGAITLINHCWVAVFKLLHLGLMCRGHIRRGNIYHEGQRVIGTGYQDAIKREKVVMAFKRHEDKCGTPFVEVDSTFINYIHSLEDECIQKMFPRFVDESSKVCVLYPFKRLSGSFSIGRDFNASKQRQQNDIIRKSIRQLKDRLHLYVDKNNPSAVQKLEHYEIGLDEQLKMCDRIDEMTDRLNEPFPSD